VPGLSFGRLHPRIRCPCEHLEFVLRGELCAGRLVLVDGRYELVLEAFAPAALEALGQLELDGDRSLLAGGRQERERLVAPQRVADPGREAIGVLAERWGWLDELAAACARAESRLLRH
jgi:hypothetical protein